MDIDAVTGTLGALLRPSPVRPRRHRAASPRDVHPEGADHRGHAALPGRGRHPRLSSTTIALRTRSSCRFACRRAGGGAGRVADRADHGRAGGSRGLDPDRLRRDRSAPPIASTRTAPSPTCASASSTPARSGHRQRTPLAAAAARRVRLAPGPLPARGHRCLPGPSPIGAQFDPDRRMIVRRLRPRARSQHDARRGAGRAPRSNGAGDPTRRRGSPASASARTRSSWESPSGSDPPAVRDRGSGVLRTGAEVVGRRATGAAGSGSEPLLVPDGKASSASLAAACSASFLFRPPPRPRSRPRMLTSTLEHLLVVGSDLARRPGSAGGS